MTVLFLLWVVSLVISGSPAISVQAKNEEQIPDDDHDEFAIVKSVGFGAGGFHSGTSINLVDESGLHFDIASLLRLDSVSESIALTQDQSTRIWQLYDARRSELQTAIATNLLNGSDMEAVKARFREIETEMKSILSPEQIDGLDRIRIQTGLARYGLDYLQTPEISGQLGLEQQEVMALRDQSSDLKSKLSAQMQDKNILANRALISELSPSQQEKWQEYLAADMKNDFLSTGLFAGNEVPKKMPRKAKVDRWRILRLVSVREEIELDQEQTDRVLDLLSTRKRDGENTSTVESQLETTLTDSQNRALDQIVLEKEYSRNGTVIALCCGSLADRLSITPKQSDELFECGQQLQARLSSDMTTFKLGCFEKMLSSLPNDRRESLARILDGNTTIKLD